MSSPQPQLMMTMPLLAPQPQPQRQPEPQPQPQRQPEPHSQPQPTPQPHPQLQTCLLEYNYSECKGCDKNFAKFQKLVANKYGIQNPSLDKEHQIVTVMGTSDATGLMMMLKEATGKKCVKVLPNPVRETGEAEKDDNKSDQEKANSPQQQQCRQRRPGATNIGEEDIGGRASGKMHNVGESSRIGRKNSMSCVLWWC